MWAIEKNPQHFQYLKKNLELAESKLSKQNIKIESFKADYKKVWPIIQGHYDKLAADEKKRTVIFFDPPYEQHQNYEWIMDTFVRQWGKDFIGQLWIEAEEKKGPELSAWDTWPFGRIKKTFTHGGSYILLVKA